MNTPAGNRTEESYSAARSKTKISPSDVVKNNVKAMTGLAVPKGDPVDLVGSATPSIYETFTFPLGFPSQADCKQIAVKAAGQQKLMQHLKKISRGSVFQTQSVERIKARCLTSEQRKLKLPQKAQVVLGMLQMRALRAEYWAIVKKTNDLTVVPEVSFVNSYFQAKHGVPLLDGAGGCNFKGVHWDEMTSIAHPMEYAYLYLGILVDLGGSELGQSPKDFVNSGVVREAYEDLFAENEFADKASLAIWAFGSITGCRWFLDYVYKHSPALFKKYYGQLRFLDYPDKSLLQNNPPGDLDREYKGLSFDLDSTDFIVNNLLHLGAWILSADAERITNQDNLIVLDHARFGRTDYKAIEELADASISISEASVFLRGHIAYARIRSYVTGLSSQVDQVQKMLADYKNAFELPGAFPATRFQDNVTLIRKIVEPYISTALPEVGLYSVVQKLSISSETQDLIGRVNDAKKQALELRTSISAEISQLAAEDPIGNQKRIERLYKETSQQSTESLKVYEELCTLAVQLDKELSEIAQFAESEIRPVTDVEGEAKGCVEPSHLEEIEIELQDIRPKLEQAQTDCQQKAEKIHHLKLENDSLKQVLASKTGNALAESLEIDVRALVRHKLSGGSPLSVEGCLTLLKALYPDVVEVLPSAWASAGASHAFEYTDKLWVLLDTLAGEYLQAICSGQSDSKARTLFPSGAYAANESEIVQNGQMTRRLREFEYNGEPHFFCRHLRIGVAQDTRKTVRVHFDIIDGKCVIAHCGEHMKL